MTIRASNKLQKYFSYSLITSCSVFLKSWCSALQWHLIVPLSTDVKVRMKSKVCDPLLFTQGVGLFAQLYRRKKHRSGIFCKTCLMASKKKTAHYFTCKYTIISTTTQIKIPCHSDRIDQTCLSISNFVLLPPPCTFHPEIFFIQPANIVARLRHIFK